MIKLRFGRKSDLAEMVQLENLVFGGDDEPYDEETFQEHLERDFIVLAHNGPILVGCAILGVQLKKKKSELISLSVHPEYRGQGIARSLIKRVIVLAQKQHADRMTLMVRVNNPIAVAMYNKIGFKKLRTVKRYYAKNGSGYLMLLKF